jgi:hypothetical protein
LEEAEHGFKRGFEGRAVLLISGEIGNMLRVANCVLSEGVIWVNYWVVEVDNVYVFVSQEISLVAVSLMCV